MNITEFAISDLRSFLAIAKLKWAQVPEFNKSNSFTVNVSKIAFDKIKEELHTKHGVLWSMGIMGASIGATHMSIQLLGNINVTVLPI